MVEVEAEVVEALLLVQPDSGRPPVLAKLPKHFLATVEMLKHLWQSWEECLAWTVATP